MYLKTTAKLIENTLHIRHKVSCILMNKFFLSEMELFNIKLLFLILTIFSVHFSAITTFAESNRGKSSNGPELRNEQEGEKQDKNILVQPQIEEDGLKSKPDTISNAIIPPALAIGPSAIKDFYQSKNFSFLENYFLFNISFILILIGILLLKPEILERLAVLIKDGQQLIKFNSHGYE